MRVLRHQLGLEVHAGNGPGRQRLEPGMVFTIEPGIYLPQESLGVRIEDDVLLTAAGAEGLSDKAPRTTDEIERLMRRGQGLSFSPPTAFRSHTPSPFVSWSST